MPLLENVPQLIPEPGTLLHSRVLQYRELLDSLPMDAYTHGCILHPELTTDSMIPKYATAEIRSKSPLRQGAGRTPALHLLSGRLRLQAAPIVNTGFPVSYQPRTGGWEAQSTSVGTEDPNSHCRLLVENRECCYFVAVQSPLLAAPWRLPHAHWQGNSAFHCLGPIRASEGWEGPRARELMEGRGQGKWKKRIQNAE